PVPRLMTCEATHATTLPSSVLPAFTSMVTSASDATLNVLFFFPSYRDLRELHSFPTRRSSDLARTLPDPATLCVSGNGRSHPSLDRKSTRLNSSHLGISYAVFCLKKKTRSVSTSETRPSARRRWSRVPSS